MLMSLNFLDVDSRILLKCRLQQNLLIVNDVMNTDVAFMTEAVTQAKPSLKYRSKSYSMQHTIVHYTIEF